MNSETARARLAFRFILVLLCAALLQTVAPAHAGDPIPPDFPKSSIVAGTALDGGERAGKGVLIHAQWFDDEGQPHKYFSLTKRFPWPKPISVPSGSGFRLRLDGVRYPGQLDVGVYKRTGLSAAPVGKHELYSCTFTTSADEPCRWVPAVAGGGQVWDVEIDHPATKGHLYIVAVGTWDDPRDPPKPVGTRSQIGTWIYHAKVSK